MRIVFMGTPAFAVPSLVALAGDQRHEVVAVITQPDRVNRRGGKIAFSPVKQWALDHDMPVSQPNDLQSEDMRAQLAAWNADVFIVVAYGKILPTNILEMPTYGCLNVHASLLPKYRGAAPIQYSIRNGDDHTGVSIMRLDEGMDTGDVLAQAALPIEEDDDAVVLTEKLATLGAEVLLDVMHDLPARLATATAQDHQSASYTKKISKIEGKIDWTRSAVALRCLVNALHTNPGVYTSFRNRRVKVHRASSADKTESTALPGSILRVDESGVYVATGEGTLILQIIQPENKQRMAATDFIHGYQVRVGEKFGESED